jgi:daunorubicin resistance ABC transporter ATP-binding subunit
VHRSDVAVVTDQLTKRFGELVAVDRLDFEVPASSVTSLLGPNGAGKTTVVRILATLATPTSGTARVCGYDVCRDPDAVRQVISLTGQFAALEPNLTARENLLLVTRLRGHGRLSARRIVDRLIEQFDIGEFSGSLIKSVSGGQRRRVDLAASLVLQPELLVLDEPTTGLDPRSRQVVWATVRELVGQGVTVLLTTQYLEEADELADHIVVMDHGRAVATGTPAELKAQIGGQRVDVVAFDDEAFRRLAAAFDGRFVVSAVPERRLLSIPAPHEAIDLLEVSRVIAQAEIAVEEVALRRPTLDDTFLALTGQSDEGSVFSPVPEEVSA